MSSTRHFCPICGFEGPEGSRAPYDRDGGSFDICPCCLFQYAVTDDLRHESFESWRTKWIASGAKWPAWKPTPPNWDAATQLRNIGIDLEAWRRSEQFNVISQMASVRTSGLRSANNGYEIQIDFGDPALTDAASNLLRIIGKYIIIDRKPINPGETVDWAASLLKFEVANDGLLSASEASPMLNRFVAGADRTLSQWLQQSEICRNAFSRHVNALYGGTVIVSPGVMSGRPCEGVRYPHKGTNTGWWLFSDDYSGDLNSMRPEHLYHVLAVQPDLPKFLCLEPGSCFDARSPSYRVWFETDVAAQDPV